MQGPRSAEGDDAGADGATGKGKGDGEDEVETAQDVKGEGEKGAEVGSGWDEEQTKEMEIAILGMMALKGS